MESANGLQFNHCPLNHCPLLHGFAHLIVHIILKLHSSTAVTGRALNLGGGGGKPPPAFNIHIGLIFNPHLIFTPPFNIHGSIIIRMGGEHRPKTQSTCTTLSGGIDPLSISKRICIPKTNYITGQQEVQRVQPLPF